VYISASQAGKDQEDDQTKDGWRCIEEDLREAGVTECGKHSRKRTADTERHCCRQTKVDESNGGING